MKLKHLPKETLFDISRNTNKVIMFANYINEINAPIVFENIYRIDGATSDVEKIELFEKDLSKTADMIIKTLEIAIRADKDGNVSDLKSEEKNLGVLFGDKYNKENKSITIAGIEMSILNIANKDDVKEKILSQHMGISGEEYKDLRKTFRALGKAVRVNKNSLDYEVDDDLKYLAASAEAEKHRPFIGKINEMAKMFSDYRNEISRNDKTLIDTSITYSRGMIDSVIKSSTYITQEGLEQTSTAHKNDIIKLKKIALLIKDSKNIDSIEIDQDSSLDAVIDLINNINSIDLNLTEKICVKVRKLGNYGAHGLFMQSGSIMALDTSTGQHSAIHELTHAVDLTNKDIFESVQRQDMIDKFTNRLDFKNPRIQDRISYLANPLEVIARAGEIAYLFEKFEHKDDETMDKFIERVRSVELSNDGKTGLSKSIDSYIRDAPIYFEFQDLKNEDITELKSFYKAYFSVDGAKPESKHIRDLEVKGSKPNSTTTIRSHSKFSAAKNPFRNFNSSNIGYIMEANLRLDIMPTQELAKMVSENISLITRSKQGLSFNEIDNQFETLKAMGEWLNKNASRDVKLDIIKDSLPLTFHYHPSETSSTAIALNNATTKEEMEKPFELTDRVRGIYYLKDRYQRTVFNALKDYLNVTISGDEIKLEEVAKKLSNTDAITHDLYLNGALSGVVRELGLAKTSEEIFYAARVAGASSDLDMVQKTLSNVLNGEEPHIIKLSDEKVGLIKSKSRYYKAGDYNYGKSINSGAVRTIKYTDNTVHQVSGMNQSRNMPDVLFASLVLSGDKSVQSMTNTLENGVQDMYDKIESSSVNYNRTLELHAALKATEHIETPKVAETKLVTVDKEGSLSGLLSKKVIEQDVVNPENEKAKKGSQLKLAF